MRLLVADDYPCRICEKQYCYKNCEKFNLWLDTVVEAEPIVHGEWIHDINNLYACSECLMRQTQRMRGRLMNYCPNCGAKMDGGKNDG